MVSDLSVPQAHVVAAKVCTGGWRGLPTGWARFTDFLTGAPPLQADGTPVFEEGEEPGYPYLYSTPAELMASGGLSEEQIAHSLGNCACAQKGDITELNNAHWKGRITEIEMGDGYRMPIWSATSLYPDDHNPRCAMSGDCECNMGEYFPPGRREACNLGAL